MARALLQRLAAFGAAAADSLRSGNFADCGDARHSNTGTVHSKPMCHLAGFIINVMDE